MARKKAPSVGRAKESALRDLEHLEHLAKVSGGNRTLASAITRGGFSTIDEALAAVLGDAVRYSKSEGVPHIEALVIRNSRRSWAIHLDPSTGHYVPLATGSPGRMRRVDPTEIRKLWKSAKETLRPIRAAFRRSTRRNRDLAWTDALQSAPDVSERLNKAGLRDALRDIPKLQDAAARLVAAEHPAVTSSTVLRLSKARQKG